MPAHAFWTANAVVNPSTRTALEYPQLKLGEDSKLWLEAASREIGRLAQGKQPDMPTGSNTMHFMDPHNLPVDDRRATYLCIVAAIKLHKAETHRIRIRKLFFSEISCTYTIFLHGHIFPTSGHLFVKVFRNHFRGSYYVYLFTTPCILFGAFVDYLRMYLCSPIVCSYSPKVVTYTWYNSVDFKAL